MFDPLTAASIAFQGGTAIYQSVLAGDLRNQPKPDQGVPPSAKQALKNAMIQANSSVIPGEEVIKGNIRESTAENYQRMKEAGLSPSSISAGLSESTSKQGGIYRDLGIKGAEIQKDNQRNFQNVALNVAGYENEAFKTNELNPYLRDQLSSKELQLASLGNIFNTLQNQVDINQQNKFMDKIYGDWFKTPSQVGGASSSSNLGGEMTQKYLQDLFPKKEDPFSTIDPVYNPYAGSPIFNG